MQAKIAVLGERDVVLAFRALGLTAVPALTAGEIARELNRLAREEYSVVFITESAAEKIPEMLSRFTSQMLPAIIPIPGAQGANGFGMQMLNDNVEKAVGMNILFND